MPSAAFSAISSAVRSSWLAIAIVVPRTRSSSARRFGVAPSGSLRLHFQDAALDGGFVETALTAQLAVEIDVGVLADTWAVVHQADHAHERVIGDRIEQGQHVQRGDFAAQMQKVVGFQQPGLGQRIQIDYAVSEGLDPFRIEPEVPQAKRVQHRGNPGRRTLRVVCDHGGPGRPARQAARLHLPFQVVGMNVDNAGNDGVAVQVDRSRRMRAAGLDVGDDLAVHDDRSASV